MAPLLPLSAAACTVTLQKQVSTHACSTQPTHAKEGDWPEGTYGCYDNGTMWVTGGCRGKFTCGSGAATITCTSTSYTARDVCACSPPTPPPPARLAVASALGSGMVLQRAPARAAVWGTAPPGARVSVAVGAAASATATADADGRWSARLPALPAGAHGAVNVSSAYGSVVLDDVLFGDVFLCSGQSNMVFSLAQAYNASEHIAAANATKYRSIRLLTATPTCGAPRADLPVEQAWAPAGAASVGNPKAFSYFSAVCWFAGKEIFDARGGDVPIGLVTSAYGGTRVHQWSSADALRQCNQSGAALGADSCLWDSMITPLLPMRLLGVFWLQGESDVNPSDDPAKTEPQRGASYYACQIAAMVRDWRAKFAAPTLPFMWVQLSPWVGHEAATSDLQLPELRQAQLAAQGCGAAGFASAVDLGDFDPSTNPWGGVHFRNKAPLGPRLARVAEALAYGRDVRWRGPEATGATLAAGGGAVHVSFAGGGSLRVAANRCPASVSAAKCGWWDVVDAAGAAHNATAELAAGGGVRVAVPPNVTAAAVRYLWADWPVATLYDDAGLPATPFVLPVAAA